jgi:hypothetical protein
MKSAMKNAMLMAEAFRQRGTVAHATNRELAAALDVLVANGDADGADCLRAEQRRRAVALANLTAALA